MGSNCSTDVKSVSKSNFLSKRFDVNSTPFAVYLVTVESEDQAKEICSALLDERLIACSNIIGGAEKSLFSIFKWEGNIENDPELLLVMKSRSDLLEEIVKVVQKHHSYDVPEIIA